MPQSDVLVIKMPALVRTGLQFLGGKVIADKILGTNEESSSKVDQATAAAQLAQQKQMMSQQKTESRENRARSMLNAGIRGDAQKSEPMDIAWLLLKRLGREEFFNRPGGLYDRIREHNPEKWEEMKQIEMRSGSDPSLNIDDETRKRLGFLFKKLKESEMLLNNHGDSYFNRAHFKVYNMLRDEYERLHPNPVPRNETVSYRYLNKVVPPTPTSTGGIIDRNTGQLVSPTGEPIEDPSNIESIWGSEQELEPLQEMFNRPDFLSESRRGGAIDAARAGLIYNLPSQRIMKERVSPEAKRHKKEYDTKYQSSPERIKYRVELNRERRKRGMYGDHSGKDISHTEGGKFTVESEHDNRARHFKDKGTLREIAKGVKEDIELLQNLLSGPMDEHDQIIVDALEQKINEEEESEEEEYIPHEFFL